jgi:hypothetical protein
MESHVSITFFVAATQALIRQHGNRLVDQEKTNRLIVLLGEAETQWKSWPKAGPSKGASDAGQRESNR